MNFNEKYNFDQELIKASEKISLNKTEELKNKTEGVATTVKVYQKEINTNEKPISIFPKLHSDVKGVEYIKLQNLNKEQILAKKIELYGKLFGLLNENYFFHEFDLFRKYSYFSISSFVFFQLVANFGLKNHPFKNYVKYTSIFGSFFIIYSGFFSNIELLSSVVNEEDNFRADIKYRVREISNEIALYSVFKNYS